MRSKSVFGVLTLALLAGVAQSRMLGEPVNGATEPAAVEAEAIVASEEAMAPVRLEVSLSKRRLHLLRGGEVVESFPVAVGKKAHPTPKGEFGIRRIIWNPRWVPPKVGWAKGKTAKAPGHPENPMGRVKMFFQEPDYYIHGTNAEESLGSAASHGCIRMANGDIMRVAKLVMESGGARRDPSWFERVRNFVTRTQEVRLATPVRVVIKA